MLTTSGGRIFIDFMMGGNTVVEWLHQLFLIYLELSLLYLIYSLIRMYVIRIKAGNKKYGKDRGIKLVNEGRFRQYPIYSPQEIRENRKRGAVRLSVFPVDGDKKTKYVIVCPGGGYMHLVTAYEGYPIAAKINELGYTAFVLEYRVGFNCSSHAPMHDLAQAVRFIESRADEFNVDTADYAVVGFSAGGNLAGTFGTHEWGYDKYKASKPGTLIMGYPWTNVNHWMEHPYWNIWMGLMGVWLSERGNLYMFGAQFLDREKRDSLCVQKWITDDYPPVYMFAGGNDVLVPSGSHTDILEKALKEHNIPHMYEKFFGVPHGVGLGLHTRAEGWLDRAIAFWQDSIKDKTGVK
ncbi:MAG: alpha/beta hydrolase [Lachnospiraceae bacterium]|nr:alpha/beta hydrolase [Lachnospiraceae bacterium]